MNLNAISLFVRVVDAGSFVAAAKISGVPKTTVARHIDELEKALGVRLLQRTTRQSKPTEAGRLFYDRCKAIVGDIDDAVAAVSQDVRHPRGRLKLTTSPLMAEAFLGEWITEYLALNPHVDIDMFLTTRSVDLVAGGFDLAIRIAPLGPSGHTVRKLAPAPSYVCAAPSYLKTAGPMSAPGDLSGGSSILYSPDGTKPLWELESLSGETTTVSVPSRLVVNSFPVALNACLQGAGVALLPSLVCCAALRSGELVRVLPDWADRSRTVHALYPSRQHLAATVRTFIDFIAPKLSPPPWDVDRPAEP